MMYPVPRTRAGESKIVQCPCVKAIELVRETASACVSFCGGVLLCVLPLLFLSNVGFQWNDGDWALKLAGRSWEEAVCRSCRCRCGVGSELGVERVEPPG